jgi:hypothetical protein
MQSAARAATSPPIPCTAKHTVKPSDPTVLARLANVKGGLFPYGLPKPSPLQELNEIVKLADLAQKLGATATRVWCAMQAIRDGLGHAHPTRAGVARKLRLSEAAVARALRKLKDAKLVEPIGREPREVPIECSEWWMLNVFVWHVHGAAFADLKWASVPTLVKRWMRTATTHGGARAGAGRPAGAKDAAQRVRAKKAVAPAPYIKPHEPTTASRFNATMAKVVRCRERLQLVPPLAATSDRRQVVQLIHEAPTGGMALVGVGPRIDPPDVAYARWLEPLGGSAVVPPIPTERHYPAAYVPTAMRFPESWSDAACVEFALRVYRNAGEALTGEKSWAFANTDVTRSEYYPALVEAIRLMREHELCAAPWVAFAIETWAEIGREHPTKAKPAAAGKDAAKAKPKKRRPKQKLPPALWIFDAARVAKWRGWFRTRADEYCVRTALLTPAHRHMIHRHEQFCLSLSRCRTLDEAHVALDVLLDGGAYRGLEDDALVTAQMLNDELLAAIRAGKWVWAAGNVGFDCLHADAQD